MPSRKSVKKTAPLLPPSDVTPPPATRQLITSPITTAQSGGGLPNFPIVALGASAGGLEAFKKFFAKMPPDSGMALVIIQHLSPDSESMMSTILGKLTRMEVHQAADGMRIEPNQVYINPPDKQLALFNGRFQLLDYTSERGTRLPIDNFFKSLAEERKEAAIGIILSGTGSDGSRGINAINEEGGMVIVQAPEDAAYDGMPRSALATGITDFVLPAGEIPERLMTYVKHPYAQGDFTLERDGRTTGDFLQKILLFIRRQTGHDFSQYKLNTIMRRVKRRMSVHQIIDRKEYLDTLQKSPEEATTLFRDLLIGVTCFFRDVEVFAAFKQKAIPYLVEHRRADDPLRIWVVGCSTGEEAYSIAMLIQEYKLETQKIFPVQIFASDIDKEAIDKARQGLYPVNIEADVSAERRKRFFKKEGEHYRINKEIREMVTFAEQSVIKDPPFSRLALISCRNMMIYLEPELQKKVLLLFHYALSPDGLLLLGTAESVGEFTDLFHPYEKKQKIFRRMEGLTARRTLIDIPHASTYPPLTNDAQPREQGKVKATSLRELAQNAVLEHFAPSCVIADPAGEILFFQGGTRDFLEPVQGTPNYNLIKMAREGLKTELGAAFRKALKQQREVVIRDLRVRTIEGWKKVNIFVRPLVEPASRQNLTLVLFESAPAPEPETPRKKSPAAGKADPQIRELEAELQSTKEYLQTTIEELETTNEELQSTNEELQSANEELQSTNEELETSKEELQSVNEELVTVNAEHQNKIEELTQTSNDMNNLLASTEIATIFLDGELRIKRFTPEAQKMIKLSQVDLGRPIGEIASNLSYASLDADVQSVLDTLVVRETNVRAKDGLWFTVRIMPYRTMDNMIDGVVITFMNITRMKKTELKQKEARAQIRDLRRQLREATGEAAPERARKAQPKTKK